ncbi:hypothetical protein GPECTOR_22g938 [Gonium pectorale]|uniref:Nucleotide-diphospho-sugar transferase domain-containing protein n=1 Tax=Gonium pectorale TaxID=33097 RepID=A0A150GHP5_GONPE|nr:hypothetical protein GPECTOR_22g938 [Gonium pectorale]|eukprot:KXZ49344.1 hypothetical protein GPECTOR_22g938 [Gonium pectorale]
MDGLRAAAVDISHLSCRKSLVILGMTNEEALTHTVPLFLQSMSRVRLSGGRDGGRTLDTALVLVAWSRAALRMCAGLQGEYRHQCVRDKEHRAARGSFNFHDTGFHALGFAKIKYILNGLSAGHDVVFLDTDVIMMADPLPYLLTHGSDLSASLEKCSVANDTLSFNDPDFMNSTKSVPPLNIGTLYFKATPGVARCVSNWALDMYGQVPWRPLVWDQDVYRLIMIKCTRHHGLRWQPLDPRVVQSACFPFCGCSFPDDAISGDSLGDPAPGRPFVEGRACAPEHWDGWLLRHFPCSGDSGSKGVLMKNLLEGMATNSAAVISKKWKRRRR